jgi:hypothetical protein
MSKPQTRQGAPMLGAPEEISCLLRCIVSGLKAAVAAAAVMRLRGGRAVVVVVSTGADVRAAMED